MSQRRTHRAIDDSEGDWLMSYADVISLLFAFLAILLSVSKIDVSKMDRLTASISGSMSGQAEEATLDAVRREVDAALAASGLTSQAEVRATSRGLEVDLRSGVLFQVGSAELSPNAVGAIGAVARPVLGMPVAIEVEGHTDSVPINSPKYPSNWELSGARASEVVRQLIRMGFQPSQLKAVGLADTRPPEAEGHEAESMEEQKARQRRVTMILIPQMPERIVAAQDDEPAPEP